ncbi:MAG TPA: efflux RND transporter periplasmic adaptor subunit [Polyangiales bacterium]
MHRNWPLVSAFVLCACAAKPQAPAAAEAPPTAAAHLQEQVRVDATMLSGGRIQLAAVEKRSLGETRIFPGEASADEQGRAEAGTLVAGRIASLEAGVGTLVQRGQVLAYIDAPEVARVAADVMRARAHAEVAVRKEARQLELDKQQATSKNAIDEAHAEARVAHAELAAAQSLLRSLGGSEPPAAPTSGDAIPLTSRVAVRSPLAGIVSARSTVLGGAVVPEKSLFEITAKGHVVVLLRFPESASDVPAAGTTATLRPRASAGSAGSCGARVRGELGTVDPGTRTRSIRVEPTDACDWLVPGGYVNVEVAATKDARASAVLAVPRDAIVDVKGLPSVFVAGATDGTFVLRAVRIGAEQGGLAEIEVGVREGERVVVVGAPLLKGEVLRSELVP